MTQNLPDENIGIYESPEEALRDLTRRLVYGLNPVQVWLFGSRARGDFRPDSDYDFIVVTRIEDGDSGNDYARARRPLRGSGVGCDVVPIRLDQFEGERHSEISVVHTAMEKAILLYDDKEGFSIPETRGD